MSGQNSPRMMAPPPVAQSTTLAGAAVSQSGPALSRTTAASPATPRGSIPGASPSPAPSAGSSFGSLNYGSATRPPYVPQFTAATQLILNRIKGEPSKLSSALVPPSATARAAIKPADFADAKRRLVSSMNTSDSLTLAMPAPKPPTLPQPPATMANSPAHNSSPAAPIRKALPGQSAIQRVSSGLSGAGRGTMSNQPSKPVQAQVKILSAESKVTKPRNIKFVQPHKGKRRVKSVDDEDSDDEITTPKSASEERDNASKENAAAATASATPAPLTTTKSGRQVLKPSTYNPAAIDASATKKKHLGKRSTEHALCKWCTRMHSPASNQIVFCDGCNEPWHQFCHYPHIPNAIVHNEKATWFCRECEHKRASQQLAAAAAEAAKKPRGPPPRISWADKPAQQKRAYLSTLRQSELVALIMTSLELHPDLPIFPGPDNSSPTNGNANGQMPRSSFAGTTTEGLFPRADAGPINYIRKVTPSKGRAGAKAQNQAEQDDEDADPLAPPWPAAGQGVYARLPPEAKDGHLDDEDDYEAFSQILYDDKGRKIEENGMKV